MAKDTFYFAHDYNARNDDRTAALIAEYGAQGYGIYWILVEMLHENESSKIEYTEKKLRRIAAQAKAEYEQFKKIVDDCIDVYDLFSNQDGFITSERVLKNKEKRERIKEIRKEAGGKGGRKKWENAGIEEFGETRKARMDRAAKIGTHIAAEWEEMVSFFNYECVKCGVTPEKITKDHIIPIYMGGSDLISNLQPLCKSCNSGKGPETTDHRLEWCSKNSRQLPTNWIAIAYQKSANHTKGKESKGNKSKEELLRDRIEAFGLSLQPHVEEFGRAMVRDFYNYWKEPDTKTKSKMRWEMEKTWDTHLRLLNWQKRSIPPKQQKTEATGQPLRNAAEMLAERDRNKLRHG